MISQRYSGICDNYSDYTYHILGCGAIGSATATQLVRMGATHIKLYDMDTVGEENIGVSMFSLDHVKKDKTEALKLICKSINSDVYVETFHETFRSYEPEGKDIVVLGFDSMEARLTAVKIICKIHKPDYIIDGRMGAEHYQQYVISNPTVSKYMKSWYSDEDGSDEPCNAKATSYCSSMSGSFISNSIRKILTNQPYHQEMSFHFPTMQLQLKKLKR